MKLISLPIDLFLDEIKNQLAKHNNIIISSTPGSGKTTRVPPALLSLSQKQIVMLQPRRIAAITSAYRMAEENHWHVGKEIGYQVRFDNKTSHETKIRIITEAILAKEIQSSPDLDHIDIVILDEFHERSIHTDLAIAYLKELQELSRPDLKIVVMSATLDTEKVSQFLSHAPVVQIESPLFELETVYAKNPLILKPSPSWYAKIIEALNQAVDRTSGHILVFLPGLREMKNLLEEMNRHAKLKNRSTHILHGSIGLNEQKKILEPSNLQKIILATNIAETSLTIDGVNCVIDTGLVRKSFYDTQSQSSKISLNKISLASAKQRAGRANRQTQGLCFKLWTSHDENSMMEFDIPEIKRSDLSELILFLASIGIAHPMSFSWYEAPEEKYMKQALQFVMSLQLIDSQYQLTELGKMTAAWPLPLPLSFLVMQFVLHNMPEEGLQMGALLSDLDSSHSLDINGALPHLFETLQNHPQKQKALRQLENSWLYFKRKFKFSTLSLPSHFSQIEKIIALCAMAFFYRLGRLRSPESPIGILYNGKGCKLKQDIHLHKSDFFLALQTTEVDSSTDLLVSQHLWIDKKIIDSVLNTHIQSELVFSFDKEKGKIYKKQIKKIGSILIQEGQVQLAEAHEIQEKIVQIVFSMWERIVENNEDLKNWLERYSYFLHMTHSEEKYFSSEKTQSAIEMASVGEKDIASIVQKDWVYFLEMQLDLNELKSLKQDFPLTYQLPNGRQISIHYKSGQNPWMQSKLQDFFGLESHPVIFKNIPIVIHLLAPNKRPTQITSDIIYFWKNSYSEVRKELKGRYPKHDWPENPIEYSAHQPKPK